MLNDLDQISQCLVCSPNTRVAFQLTYTMLIGLPTPSKIRRFANFARAHCFVDRDVSQWFYRFFNANDQKVCLSCLGQIPHRLEVNIQGKFVWSSDSGYTHTDWDEDRELEPRFRCPTSESYLEQNYTKCGYRIRRLRWKRGCWNRWATREEWSQIPKAEPQAEAESEARTQICGEGKEELPGGSSTHHVLSWCTFLWMMCHIKCTLVTSVRLQSLVLYCAFYLPLAEEYKLYLSVFSQ